LRDWNSDTGAAWTTYTAGVASLTVVGSRLRAVPSADVWANLADTAPTIDRQELAGVTPKTAVPPADAWGNLADTAPTIIYTANLSAALPADALGSYSDSTTPIVQRIGILSSAPPSDSLANWVDSLNGVLWLFAYVDLVNFFQLIALGAVLPADSLNNWADTPPTITRIGNLKVSLPNDAWGNLADQAPTVDRQIISVTPITVTPPADAWANLADTTPTFSQFGYKSISPPADALGGYADSTAPTIKLIGNLSISLQADSLNNWADDKTVDLQVAATTPITVTLTDNAAFLADTELKLFGDHLVLLDPDSLNAWADNRTVDLQSVATTPLTANPSADGLNNWSDDRSFKEIGILAVAPAADSLNLWTDPAPTLTQFGYKSVTLPADDLAAWSDSPAFAEFGYLTAAPAADSLNLWADDKTISLQDVVSTPITKAPPADAWANLADQAPTIKRIGVLSPTPPADSVTWNDSLKGFLVHRATTDTDNLNNWDDTAPTAFQAIRVNVPADAWGNLADQAPTVQRIIILKVNVPADTWAGWGDDRSFSRMAPKVADLPADALGAYNDSIKGMFGLYPSLSDDLSFLDALNANLSMSARLSDAMEAFVDGLDTSLITPLMAEVDDAMAAYGDSVDAFTVILTQLKLALTLRMADDALAMTLKQDEGGIGLTVEAQESIDLTSEVPL
jgi:hypothetical protein